MGGAPRGHTTAYCKPEDMEEARRLEEYLHSTPTGSSLLAHRAQAARADAQVWKDLLQQRLLAWGSDIAKPKDVSAKNIVIACEVSSTGLVDEGERATVYAHLPSASAKSGRMFARQNFILCQP